MSTPTRTPSEPPTGVFTCFGAKTVAFGIFLAPNGRYCMSVSARWQAPTEAAHAVSGKHGWHGCHALADRLQNREAGDGHRESMPTLQSLHASQRSSLVSFGCNLSA